MKRIFLSALAAAAMSFPASLSVAQQPASAPAAITFADQRSNVQRTASRKSPLASTALLGEETLKPAGLVRLQKAMAEASGATAPKTVVVKDFALIDYFPKRLSVMRTAYGGLTSSIVSEMLDSRMDWALVEQLGLPKNGEAIVCLFSGEIDGKPVRVATFAEYHTPMTALSIRASKPFLTAVNQAVDDAAKKALEQAK